MTPRDPLGGPREGEHLLRSLTRDLTRESGSRAAGPCPDDEQIASFAEGRLDAGARARVASHVSACEACGGVVAALAESAELDAPASSRMRRRWPLRLAAAAAALLAIALGWQWLGRSPGTG